MAPNPNLSSGYNTPISELEGPADVHPTAARRPHAIVVQSENTQYTDEHITAVYHDRGANVELSNGQFIVTPTVRSY
jgi:myo-inositol-1-phosphate synthase